MRSRVKLAAAAVAALIAATGVASAAQADVVPDAGCADGSASQVFSPWLDPASYVLAPDGGFEAGAPDWSLAGAQVASDNEPWTVRDAADGLALAIDGGSATSPPVCVGLERPTIRFFARNTGSPLGALSVEALVNTVGGLTAAVPIGVVTDLGDRWAPRPPMPIVANLLPLLPDDDHTTVRLRFSALGVGSSWALDDVYVDPYSKG
jgi:hypothetical protein